MARKDYYKGVTIQYEGDSTKLSAVLAKMNTEMRQSQGAARALDAALKWDGSNVNLIIDRIKVCHKQIETTEERVKALKSALETAEDPEVIERLSTQSIRAETKLKELQDQLEKLTKQAVLSSGSDFSGFAAGITEFGDKLQAVGGAMQEFGDKATMHLTAPIVAFTAATVSAATTVDTALTDVRKTVDGTEEEYQALKDAAIEYSKTNGVTADQVLEVQALGAQLGYAKDELEMLGRVGSGLDIATNMNAEKATTDMAQFANITGMAHEKSENYASTIIALGNHTATTESKISDMAQGIAAAGTQVGMSESEILGLSAALSSVGMEAEAGGSAISTIMSQIDKDVATNSDNVATWAQTAKMSAKEFADEWRSSPVYALQEVLAGMQDTSEAGGNMSVMLEDLGIKSLRQTDAMKRLAGNSDLVRNTVALANEAWQENTALADEVASKNDSLAAKMQMLQNRVTAIMEQIGKPLADALLAIVDAAEPLFDAVEGGSRAFADMDKSQQQMIVSAAALVAAVGPASSIFGRLASDAGGLVSGLGEAGKGVLTFVECMKAGYTATESLAMVSETLGATLATGLVGVGIAAAVAAIGTLVGEYQKWRDYQQDVTDATADFEDAIKRMDDATASYGESVRDTVTSLQDLRDKTKEVISDVADSNREMADAWEQLGTDNAVLDKYVEQLGQLADGGSLTTAQLELLNDAVGRFNDATGASLSVIDQQTGKLSLSKGEIEAVVEAHRKQEQARLASEQLTQALEDQARMEAQLKENADRGATAIQNENARMSEYTKTLANAPQATSAALNETNDLAAAYEKSKQRVEGLQKQIEAAASVSFPSLESAMVASGVTTEQYNALTKEQLDQLRAKFDGTLKSIADLLAGFGISVKGAGDVAVREAEKAATDTVTAIDAGAQKAAEAQRKASQQAISDQQKANAQLLRERQKEFDEENRQLQKAFDRENKDRQKQNEQVVKLIQKQNEQANKLAQKQDERSNKELRKRLDRQYKSRSSAYSREEDALRKSNDAKMAEMRAADKAAEDELKSALAKRLSERTKELEKEAAARRAANQAQLKEARQANQQATKDFKAETDRRIKEIERQKQAQLDLASANGDRKTAGIDAQIAALNAETKAEQDAIRQREQQDKVAELQRAVDRAKSRRKRAEAEKELNDYLAEIAQEAREDERAAEISRLEDQKSLIKNETDAKRSAIEERFAKERELYEQQRQEQLEREDAQRQEDYDRLSERLAEQLTLRQESNAAIIEGEKAANDLTLTQMREQHAQQETLRAESFAKQLEKMQENHSSELESLKEAQSEKMDAQREMQSEALDAQREMQSEQLDSLREAQSEQLDAQRESQQDALRAQQEAQQQIMDDLRESLDAQVQAMRDAMDAENAEVEVGGETVAKTAKEKAEKATKSTEDALKPMPGKVRKLAGLTLSDYLNVMNLMPGESYRIGDTSGHSLQERLDAWNIPTSDSAKALRDAALRDIEGLPGEYGTKGDEAGTNLVTNLDAKQPDAATSSQSLADAVLNPFTDFSGAMGGYGESGGQSFANSLEFGGSGAGTVASNIRNDVESELSAPSAESNGWGFDTGWNFFIGLQSMAESIWEQARSIAEGVANILGHSIAKEGPMHEGGRGEVAWGEHLIQNFMRGMSSQESALVTQTQRIAALVEDNFDPQLAARFDANLNYASDYAGRALVGAREAVANALPPEINVYYDLHDVRLDSARDIRETARDLAYETVREITAQLRPA